MATGGGVGARGEESQRLGSLRVLRRAWRGRISGRRHALYGWVGVRKFRLRLGVTRVAHAAAAGAVVGGRLAGNERG